MQSTYRFESSHAKTNAQRNLWGRSHYADSDTLRYFHSRILSAHHIKDGQLFYIIESCAADMHNTRRVFRGVVFDLAGQIIYRPSLEESFSNSKKAAAAMWAFLNSASEQKAA